MAQQTKKELVRLLSIEHGYKRASELADVDYAVVRQWAVRGKWKQKQDPSQCVTQAADALTSKIAEHKQTTKLHLAKYSAEAAQQASERKNKLYIAQDVRHVAAVASSVWPEERQGESGLTLNLLNLVMPTESARRSAHEDE